LPAIPLSILVKSLLEKSLDIGLSDTVEQALESGVVVSRKNLERMHAAFESDVRQLVAKRHGGEPQKAERSFSVDGVITLRQAPAFAATDSTLPPGLDAYHMEGALKALLKKTGPVREREAAISQFGERYYESEDRTYQLALWEGLLLHGRADPDFLENANRVLAGRQLFAQLRLAQATLGRSFFYPFIVVYCVILALSLALALLMSERRSQPSRRLAQGANAVADGNWTYRSDAKAGGEVGRLVHAFNTMVSRLDAQRRRLVDMERMATWRDMARHLAHEIKNPLLPIRLTVEELKDQYKGDDGRYREMLAESTRVIGDELDHLTKLVKEFSSFARMPDIAPQSGRLEPLISDVARLYPQLSTSIECEAGLPEFPFDPDQIRIVLVNLFENTASVIDDASQAQIRVSVGKVGGDVVLLFTDNGPGIPGENLPKVFDPYFTTREEGTGLGLAMVKNIVLLHGGSIHVHSAEGKGTTFTMALPLTGPPEKEES
jgi:nitrogen fixation/metabolism regulation signal transduction histidine kinase